MCIQPTIAICQGSVSPPRGKHFTLFAAADFQESKIPTFHYLLQFNLSTQFEKGSQPVNYDNHLQIISGENSHAGIISKTCLESLDNINQQADSESYTDYAFLFSVTNCHSFHKTLVVKEVHM